MIDALCKARMARSSGDAMADISANSRGDTLSDVAASATVFHHSALWKRKHVLHEIKLSVIIFVGGAIIIACLIYIVVQCRCRPSQRKQTEDKEILLHSQKRKDSFDEFVQERVGMKETKMCSKEFYV